MADVELARDCVSDKDWLVVSLLGGDAAQQRMDGGCGGAEEVVRQVGVLDGTLHPPQPAVPRHVQ